MGGSAEEGFDLEALTRVEEGAGGMISVTGRCQLCHGEIDLACGSTPLGHSRALTPPPSPLLRYANAKIYKCDPAEEGVPGNYRAKGSSAPDVFEEDGKTWRLQRHVSFVDCPGHDILVRRREGRREKEWSGCQ